MGVRPWKWFTCCLSGGMEEPLEREEEKVTVTVTELATVEMVANCAPTKQIAEPTPLTTLTPLSPICMPVSVSEPCMESSELLRNECGAQRKEESHVKGEEVRDTSVPGSNVPMIAFSELDDLKKVAECDESVAFFCTYDGRKAFAKFVEKNAMEVQIASIPFPCDKVVQVLSFVDGNSRPSIQGVMYERAERDLHQHLKKTELLHPRSLRLWSIFEHLLEGLGSIHAQDCLHLDIKPSNILVFGNDLMKYTDFGMAQRFNRDQQKDLTLDYACGTVGHMAPEVVFGLVGDRSWANEGSDVYSLGCTFHWIVKGASPFPDIDNVDPTDEDAEIAFLQEVATGDKQPFIDTGCEELDMLLEGMVCFHPEARWTVQKALSHVRKIQENMRMATAEKSKGMTVKVHRTRAPPLRRLPLVHFNELDDLRHISECDDSIVLFCTYRGRKMVAKFMDKRDTEVEMAAALLSSNSVVQVLGYVNGIGGPNIRGILYESAQLDLHEHVRRTNLLPPQTPRLWCIIEELLLALSSIHELGYIHLDIKPANILMFDHGQFKFGDFGMAQRFVREEQKDLTLQYACGTFGHIAPEVLGALVGTRSWANERSDVYSLGCTFHWLVEGTMPYPNIDDIGADDEEEQVIFMEDIATGAILPVINTGYDHLDTLLKGMVSFDPEKRWSVKKALRHVRKYWESSTFRTESD